MSGLLMTEVSQADRRRLMDLVDSWSLLPASGNVEDRRGDRNDLDRLLRYKGGPEHLAALDRYVFRKLPVMTPLGLDGGYGDIDRAVGEEKDRTLLGLMEALRRNPP